jgi:hypothetical protein
VLNLPESKVISGGYFVMALLAGFGWDRLWTWVSNIRGRWKRRLLFAGFVAVSSLFFMTTARLYLDLYPAQHDTFSQDLFDALQRMMAESGAHQPLILSDSYTSVELVGLAPVRVWLGQWTFAENFDVQIQEEHDAGLTPKLKQNANLDSLKSLIQQAKPDYIVISMDAPGIKIIDQVSQIKRVQCYVQFCLYAPVTGKDSRIMGTTF